LLFAQVTSEKLEAVGKVRDRITSDECKKLHPEQWVKVYGVVAHRYDYIISCQVYQRETLVCKMPRDWWDGYVLEPVDEEEQPISVEEALERGRYI
jgi:hypothetical protein